jgi:Mrp family chromosome partitioning ATPase
VSGTPQPRRLRREGVREAVAIVIAVMAAGVAGAAAFALLNGDQYESTATVRGAAALEQVRGADLARRALDLAGARGAPAADLLDHSEVERDGAGLAFTVRADEPAAARRLATAYARAYVESLPERSRARAGRAGPAEETGEILPAALVGAGAGLLAGLALALLRELLDVRRSSSRRVGARLGLPELGRVPEAPAAVEDAYVVDALEGGPAAEAYARLGARVEEEAKASSARVVLVCGTVEEDRGEQVAAGLAAALAAAGRRVAVVELDPARPTLRRQFALARGPGATELARGEATLDEALAPVPGVDGLAVLAAGAADPGAAPGAIRGLRQRFDLVVVAGPPLLRDGDVRRDWALVPPDAVVLAVDLRAIRHSRRPRLERTLDGLEVPVLGYVLLASAGGGPRLSGSRA